MTDALVLAGLLSVSGLGWYFLYWPSLRAIPVKGSSVTDGTIPNKNGA